MLLSELKWQPAPNGANCEVARIPGTRAAAYRLTVGSLNITTGEGGPSVPMVAGTTSICSDVCEQFGSVWPSRVWPNLDDLTAQAILFELTSK